MTTRVKKIAARNKQAITRQNEINRKKNLSAKKAKGENMTTFKWAELDKFYANANSMFIIAEPAHAACTDAILIAKLKAKGKYEEFERLVRQLKNDLQEYGTRLDAIREQHANKVDADPQSEQYMYDAAEGMGISMMYKEWIEGFGTTVIEGTALDIKVLTDTVDIDTEVLKDHV